MAKKNKSKKSEAAVINESIIENVSNAKIIMTLERAAKESSTPAGDYFVKTPLGTVRIRKSDTGRLSWQLEGEQIARSPLYNMMKDAGKNTPDTPPEEEKKVKKDKKEAKEEVESSEEDGPAKAVLEATYKKKQLLNVLKKNQIFKKRHIKALEEAITEKKLTGSTFITYMDDTFEEEVPVEKINKIFTALKK